MSRQYPRSALDGQGGFLRFKDLLDASMESPRQRERQRQAWVVLARLDRIHGLARDAQPLRELRLRPVQLSAQDPQPILHRYRNVKMAVPTAQKAAINGITKVQSKRGMPTPSKNPYANVIRAVAPSENPKASV